MRSLDVKGALRRRWYLLVAGLLATVGLLTAAVTLVGPTHEVKSSVLMVPPPLSVVGYPNPEAPGNPFLRLDGMDPVVSVLVTQMTSKQVSDRMLAGQPGGSYELAQDPLSQAPIIVVTAAGPNDAAAELIRDRVTDAMPGALLDLQVNASVRPQARITLTDLVVDAHASTVWRGLVRILILIAAAGIVGTLLFIGAVDAIARSRKDARRRRALEEEDAEPPAEEEGQGPSAEEAEEEDAEPPAEEDSGPSAEEEDQGPSAEKAEEEDAEPPAEEEGQGPSAEEAEEEDAEPPAEEDSGPSVEKAQEKDAEPPAEEDPEAAADEEPEPPGNRRVLKVKAG